MADLKRMVDRRLAHLSEEELHKVLWLYLGNKMPVGEIVRKYGISVDPAGLYKILPPLETKRVCPHCGETMYREVEPRNNYKRKYNKYDYFCLNCGHKVYEKSWNRSCNCETCRGEKDETSVKKRALIREHYGKGSREFLFSNLKLSDQVSLLYLLRLNQDEMRGIGIPIQESSVWTERLNRFIDKGYLTVSPESDLAAFKDCEEFPEIYYLYKAKYDVHVVISEKERAELLAHAYFQKHAIWAEKVSVLKEYLFEDLLNKFISMMEEKSIAIEVKDKTKKAFRDLIEKLSYGEVLFFFDKVRKHCIEKIEKGTMTEEEAGRMAFPNVVKFYERNVEKGWSIYKREIERVGDELWFFLQNVLCADLSVLDVVPTVDYFLEQSEVEEPSGNCEESMGAVSSPKADEEEERILRSGEMADSFGKKLFQFWILCFPEKRFGELMVEFLESLDEPTKIEDEEFLEAFRKYCRRESLKGE